MTTSVNPDRLREILRALGERVTAEVHASRSSGQLTIRRQQYITRLDFSLWYSVDPAVMNFGMETTEEDDCSSKDIDSVLEKQVFIQPEHALLVQVLENTGKNVDLARKFSLRVAYDAALKTAPQMDQHIAAMLRDVTDSPHEFYGRLWLTGITLSNEVIQISDSLSFRRPTRKDLQEKVRIEEVPYTHAGFVGRTHFSCIAECTVPASHPLGLQRYVDRLVTVLRLFRLGSVSVPRYDYNADSLSPFAKGSFGGHQGASRLEYTLSPDDQPRLLRALQVLIPLVPSTYGSTEARSNFLSTAFDWYKDSVLAGGPIESTVAWAVACLEALFLGDNPQTELSYRLTQRVVALLRCLGWAPLEVRQVLKMAYDVRSKYVHGAVSRKKLPHEELRVLHRNIAEYARVSCLVWIQLLTMRNRKEVLATLEEALIDDSADMRLRQWCNRVDFSRKPW